MSATLPESESPSEHKVPRCLVFRDDGVQHHLSDLSAISDVLDSSRLIWLDVVDPTPEDTRTLKEEFGLHPLSIEDATSKHELPKIEQYDNYWFLVVHGITRSGEEVTVHEISVFVGERFVVTVRESPAYPLNDIERRWRAQDAAARHTSGTLLYYLLDAVVDGYALVSDVVTERVETLEDELFGRLKHSKGVFREIYQMKKQTQRFRRSVAPMPEILGVIRREVSGIAETERAYLRDVSDHARRVIEQLDGARDLLSTALDIHFSVSAQQQNEVAKQLTIVATIFLPLTYVTGFFGQNFGFLTSNIADGRTFWWLGIGTEVLSVVALGVWFRVRGWI